MRTRGSFFSLALCALAALLLLTGPSCEPEPDETVEPDPTEAAENPEPDLPDDPGGTDNGEPDELEPGPDGDPGTRKNSGRAGTDPPPSSSAVAELLSARHDGDLPDRATLDAHEGAEQSLIWLSDHHEALLVQGRALEALALYPGDHNRDLLFGVAVGTRHSKVRASAVRALGAWDLSAETAVRELLVGLLSDPQVPVALAAAKALTGVPEAEGGLNAVIAAEGTPAAVVTAAQAALAP